MKKIIFLGAFLMTSFSFAQNSDAMVVQEIPFNMLEETPTFPGCESNDKDCFNSKIKELVTQNFNIDVAKGLTGKQMIATQFTISTDGSIKNVTVKAANQALKNEAKRVIALLPQFEPQLVDGKEVAVVYALPIIFEVNSTKNAKNFGIQEPSRPVRN